MHLSLITIVKKNKIGEYLMKLHMKRFIAFCALIALQYSD